MPELSALIYYPIKACRGHEVDIPNVEMAVVKPCARCVVTTIDKEMLAQSKEPLKTLASYRTQEGGAMFGQNIIPLNEGRLEIGMKVEILSKRE